MSLTPDERKNKLNRLLELLQTSNYTYSKEKGGISLEQLPPPSGSRINCESAARVFMQIAADMGVDQLQAVYYKATATNARGDAMGYFVPTNPFVKALGNQPEISNRVLTGWEFDNHWRVKDPITGITYDPTFGTSSPNNPAGIIGTSMETGTNFSMTTVYGKKYSVKRQGITVTCEEVSPLPVPSTLLVSDASFTPKLMTGLRA